MLANWVKQSTSTAGTGTITLDGTPPAGFIAFSDAFIDGQNVFYTIEDGNNREAGYGLLAAGASWTLAREWIYEKLESGVYTQYPSTPLSLSGSAVVSVSAVAQNADLSPNVIRWFSTRIGMRVFPVTALNTSYSTMNLVANYVFLYPHKISAPIKATGAGLYVNTASGTKARVGIYSVSPNMGTSGNLIAESGDIATTSSGMKSASFPSPVVLNPGWYFIGAVADSSLSVRTIEDIVRPAFRALGGSVRADVEVIYSLGSGWTSMPSTITRTSDGNERTNMPALFVEAA